MSVRRLVAVVLAAGVLAGAARAALAGDQTVFSADERARLERGELVERRATRAHGDLRLMGGASWQVIDSPPPTVWRALLDTPRYPRFLPQVAEARLVDEDGDTRKVFVRHGGLASASYYVALRVDSPERDLSFRIEESQARGVRAAWGFYHVRPHGDRKTLLAFGIMADIGGGLISALVRPQVHEWMMKVPWMVKRFVEGSGRYLYKPATAAVATAAR